MPTRMIREGFLDSEKINSLSEKEQNFFIRLMLIVDDYGRMDGRPELLRSKCYPVNDKKPTEVSIMLSNLSKVGLIVMYEQSQKPYIQILNFGQRLRQKKEKYPEPTSDSIVRTSDSKLLLEEKRREEEEKKKRRRFTPPSIDEVKDYISEKKYNVDYDKWYNFYQSKGWMVGTNKMIDWKAAVRTWNKPKPEKKQTGWTMPDEQFS